MEEVGELKCRSVNSCESTWAPIFSLTIASIFFTLTFQPFVVWFHFFDHLCLFSVTRRSRSDSRQLLTYSLTHSLIVSTDLTDVTLVSDDTY